MRRHKDKRRCARCGDADSRVARMMLVLTGMGDNCQNCQNYGLWEAGLMRRAGLEAAPERESAKRQSFA